MLRASAGNFNVQALKFKCGDTQREDQINTNWLTQLVAFHLTHPWRGHFRVGRQCPQEQVGWEQEVGLGPGDMLDPNPLLRVVSHIYLVLHCFSGSADLLELHPLDLQQLYTVEGKKFSLPCGRMAATANLHWIASLPILVQVTVALPVSSMFALPFRLYQTSQFLFNW